MALPKIIEEMKKTPGRYAIASLLDWRNGFYTIIEVMEDGMIYELDYENKRDVILGDEGWNPDVIDVTRTVAAHKALI